VENSKLVEIPQAKNLRSMRCLMFFVIASAEFKIFSGEFYLDVLIFVHGIANVSGTKINIICKIQC